MTRRSITAALTAAGVTIGGMIATAAIATSARADTLIAECFYNDQACRIPARADCNAEAAAEGGTCEMTMPNIDYCDYWVINGHG
ncbi:hypothetical protein [Actinoallomurus sp. NPDC050550]|uniref:hypothetical protein n=1 Tax=Actinoallomurus sp. NPDC050550 TaxID=3154937 RepID=UPI0033D5AE0D